MRRLPPLTAIEAFVEVARLGSVKSAAEALSLSAPALSRRLATMERFAGQPLFERRHQLLVITAEGNRLIGRMAPAIEALAAALEQPKGDVLRLRVGVQPLFASQRLMPQLTQLRDRHPDLHVEIDTAPHALARLNDGLDAAIVLATDPDPSLHARRIDSNRIVAIGNRESVARLSDPRQLSGETVMIHRSMPETFEVWREAIGLPELEPSVVDFLDAGQLMLEAAAGGLGVAFMLDSHLQAAGDPRLAALFDTQVASPYNYWFMARRSAMARKPVRLFHDWLFEGADAPARPAAA